MENCPICSNQLSLIDVAPCFDCGHRPHELEECAQGGHEYHVFELWERNIVLCDFCDADFGSYYPDYWGMPRDSPSDFPLHIVRKIEIPCIEQDLYCASCDHRLAFLLFRSYALAYNVM